MNPPGVRIVVFDLGGVVVRICRSWAEGVAAAGLPIRGPAEGPEAITSTGAVDARRALSRAYQQGEMDCHAFFRAVSSATGGLYSPDEIRRIHDAWLLDEYPGVCDLIGDLHARDILTGVLSNTNHAHWERLAGPAAVFPTPNLVRHLHASHLLGASKPEEKIYTAFEQATGFAGPQILFFDDLEENVHAARARGWHAHQVDHTGDTAAEMRGVLRAMRLLD